MKNRRKSDPSGHPFEPCARPGTSLPRGAPAAKDLSELWSAVCPTVQSGQGSEITWSPEAIAREGTFADSGLE